MGWQQKTVNLTTQPVNSNVNHMQTHFHKVENAPGPTNSKIDLTDRIFDLAGYDERQKTQIPDHINEHALNEMEDENKTRQLHASPDDQNQN